MAKGIYSALSGALAAEAALDVTAQNLANSSTAGYQQQRAIFREVLDAASPPRGVANPNRMVGLEGTVIDVTVGVIRSTGGKLDAALPEGAFLTVRTPNGDRFTRSGALSRGPEGELLAAGMPVLDAQGEPIVLEPGAAEAEILADGGIAVGGARVADLGRVRFDAPERLVPEGSGLYAPTTASGIGVADDGALTVGAVEESNASPTLAMTELIGTTRVFEAFQRAIDAFRDADKKVVAVLAG